MATPPIERTNPRTTTPRARPDARPMRLTLGAGGLAALSALAATIVAPIQPSPPVTADLPQPTTDPQATPTGTEQVRYVQLSPGQTAPPGATVIRAGSSQMTVVVTIPPKSGGQSGGGSGGQKGAPPPAATQPPVAQKTPAPKTPAPKTPAPTIKTSQSGKKP
jgi:hypothetical protein